MHCKELQGTGALKDFHQISSEVEQCSNLDNQTQISKKNIIKIQNKSYTIVVEKHEASDEEVIDERLEQYQKNTSHLFSKDYSHTACIERDCLQWVYYPAGITIALVYQWHTALVATGLNPLIIIAGAVKMAVGGGFSVKTEQFYKDSSALITEPMLNIPHQGIVLQKYSEKLKALLQISLYNGNISGILFGFSQSIMYQLEKGKISNRFVQINILFPLLEYLLNAYFIPPQYNQLLYEWQFAELLLLQAARLHRQAIYKRSD